MMDMMCVKVQDHLNSLRFTETSSVQEDMKVAENLMKDARNSKTVRRLDLQKYHFNLLSWSETLKTDPVMSCASGGLGTHTSRKTDFSTFPMSSLPLSSLQLLPNLYHLRSGGSKGACVGAIQDKLESMAGEVARVMDEQLQVLRSVQRDSSAAMCDSPDTMNSNLTVMWSLNCINSPDDAGVHGGRC